MSNVGSVFGGISTHFCLEHWDKVVFVVGWFVCFLFVFVRFVCVWFFVFVLSGGGGGLSLKMYFIISYRWLFSLLMPVLVWVLCVVVSASKDVSRLVGVSFCAFFVQSIPSSASGCPASFPMQPAVLVFGLSAVTHLPCPPMKTQQ